MNIKQALDRLRGGNAELAAIADAVEAAISPHVAKEIQRLHERVNSAADGLRERDAEIERLTNRLNQIASIAHAGGKAMTEGLALVEIRKLSLPHWKQAALNTEDKT